MNIQSTHIVCAVYGALLIFYVCQPLQKIHWAVAILRYLKNKSLKAIRMVKGCPKLHSATVMA